MQSSNEIRLKIKSASVIRSAVIGAVIGLVFISVFLLGVKHSDPSWPKYWQIRPLLVVPVATACGGMFVYIMTTLFKNNMWVRVIAAIIGIVGFIISLWLGSVLGLDGTLWN